MGKDYLHTQLAKKDWTGKALKYANRKNSDFTRQHNRKEGKKEDARKKEEAEDIEAVKYNIRIIGMATPLLDDMEEQYEK